MVNLKNKKINIAEANHGLNHECYNAKDVEQAISEFRMFLASTGCTAIQLDKYNEIFGRP